MALMRITWGKVRPGGWPTFVDAFNRSVDPSHPGLLRRSLARDRNDPDSFFIVAVWRTEQDMLDARTKQFMSCLVPHLLGDYTGSVCELIYEAPSSIEDSSELLLGHH